MLGEVKSSNLFMPTVVKHLLGTRILQFFSHLMLIFTHYVYKYHVHVLEEKSTLTLCFPYSIMLTALNTVLRLI